MANVACFDQPAVVPPDDCPSEDVALGSSPGAGLGNGQLTQRSTPADKITLFRSLFRGREDVYPRRFASRKTGLAGYAPACANEWIRGVCEKPRIKCAECPNRRFLPVTDQVIRQHLSGHDEFGREFVIGVYPLLLDETCFLLAVDLDGNTWEKDAGAFLETCRRLALPVALERSRSGKGGHIWIFFAEAISATVARNFGSHLLTETMENRPEIGLSSYDRLFPNQDTMPKGGFGNLIALPLQKGPREAGNTVFLDEQFRPLFDQWTFLSSVQKVPRSQVEALARPGDLLSLHSTSGESPNVIRAAQAAQARGIPVVAFLGKGGGQLKALADVALVVPSDDTARIQELHLAIEHLICDIVEDRLKG